MLNRRFGKRLTPAAVTWTGLAAHAPIAYLIAENHLLPAGFLLAFFGLFDTLDGALARVQHTDSPKGMFLDASTDRLKEIILYVGFTVLFVRSYPDWAAVAAVLACGLSLGVSYVKAKGEAAISAMPGAVDHQALNRIFGEGIGSFEVRITLLIIGCLFGIPDLAVAAVASVALFTLIGRFKKVMRALS
jgi:phosphatidylglycerophosphate synthase